MTLIPDNFTLSHMRRLQAAVPAADSLAMRMQLKQPGNCQAAWKQQLLTVFLLQVLQ